jgi:hypothetical protein
MAYSKKEIETKFNKICELIAEQGISLRKALKEVEISSQTFYIWIDNDEEKSKQYARASDDRHELIFEDIVIIADDQEADTYLDKDGVEQINHNVIQRARLRVDSRKWALSKMNPKKYGDRIEQDITLKQEQPLFLDVPKDNSDK